MALRNGRLGIMVTETQSNPPFSDPSYYRKLCIIGARHGLTVYVFSPGRIDWRKRTLTGYGYIPARGSWEKRSYPLPDLIYDRCFFYHKKDFAVYRTHVRRLHRRKNTRFLNTSLRGKWYVHSLLSTDPALVSLLPDTKLVKDLSQIESFLTEHHEVILKPQGSSQGRGVMHIYASKDSRFQYLLRGRRRDNRLFLYGFYHIDGLTHWLGNEIHSLNYVMQPYLALSTKDGEPFDIRSFVQKNNRGRWTFIGTAARIGKPGSLTSNLHGGGHAEEAAPFLRRQFGNAAGEMLHLIQDYSIQIAHLLEAKHGRLMELGIDFGVDRSGKLWILEVNSKPGRSIFTQIRNQPARRSVVRNPILYASYLWNRQLGG